MSKKRRATQRQPTILDYMFSKAAMWRYYRRRYQLMRADINNEIMQLAEVRVKRITRHIILFRIITFCFIPTTLWVVFKYPIVVSLETTAGLLIIVGIFIRLLLFQSQYTRQIQAVCLLTHKFKKEPNIAIAEQQMDTELGGRDNWYYTPDRYRSKLDWDFPIYKHPELSFGRVLARDPALKWNVGFCVAIGIISAIKYLAPALLAT